MRTCRGCGKPYEQDGRGYLRCVPCHRAWDAEQPKSLCPTPYACGRSPCMHDGAGDEGVDLGRQF